MPLTRTFVKIRENGTSTIITLPRLVLEKSKLKEGDRVLIQVEDVGMLTVTKEREER